MTVWLGVVPIFLQCLVVHEREVLKTIRNYNVAISFYGLYFYNFVVLIKLCKIPYLN